MITQSEWPAQKLAVREQEKTTNLTAMPYRIFIRRCCEKRCLRRRPWRLVRDLCSLFALYLQLFDLQLNAYPGEGNNDSETITVKERPPKRRRTAGGATLTTRYEKTVEPSAAVTGNGASVEPGTRVDNPRPGREQTAYDESSDSIESDLDWEEVDLAQTAVQEDDSNQNGALDLVLGGNKPLKSPERMSRKRKPATTAERKLRLEIHKMHVLCLLAHVHLRNHWCNDEQVHVSACGSHSPLSLGYTHGFPLSGYIRRMIKERQILKMGTHRLVKATTIHSDFQAYTTKQVCVRLH